MANINFKVGFSTDKSGLVTAKKELQQIQDQLKKIEKEGKIKIDTQEFEKLKGQITGFESAMKKAFDMDTGVVNVKKLTSELNKQNISLDDLQAGLAKTGVTGVGVFQSLQREVLTTSTQIRKGKSALDEMAETFSNTVKWSAATTVLNTVTGSVQKAIGFVKSLDKSLNQIQVVTGKNSKEMSEFAKNANEAAKNLGRSTTEYTDASLIFFQQGKSAEEVQKLTEATLMGANVTGMDTAQTAELLTAVMNGYQMEASKALDVTDKLAAVGAATGSDFEEMAEAMSKVASQANNAGVGIDQLGGMISTVATVTREDASIIGTSFKTILGRLGDVKLGKDVEGWDTGQVQEALNKVGMSITDENGQLKEAGVILDELGSKWNDMSKASQIGVAKQIAGLEQYNRLVALMDNWDMALDAIAVSEDAAGATLDQNITRYDSIEFKMKQMVAESEKLYSNIFSPDVIGGFYEIGDAALSSINNIIEGLGGIGHTLTALGGLAAQIFSKQIAKELDKVVGKVENLGKSALDTFKSVKSGDAFSRKELPLTDAEKRSKREAENIDGDNFGDTKKVSLDIVNQRVKMRQQEKAIVEQLTNEELDQYNKTKESLLAEQEKLKTLTKQREEKVKAAKEALGDGKDGKEFTADELERKLNANQASQRSQEDAIATKKKLIEDTTKLLREENAEEKIGNLLRADVSGLTAREKALRKSLTTEESIQDILEGRVDLEELLKESREVSIFELEGEQKVLEQIREEEEHINNLRKERSEDKTTSEEKDSQDRINELSNDIDNTGKAALRREAFQAGVETVGALTTSFSALHGAMQVYNDDTATAEERQNAMSAGMATVGTSLLMLLPTLFSLKASLLAAGGAAASLLAPLAIVVAVVGGLALLGAGIYKLIQYFDPYNQAVRENNELLEEQNKILDESRKKMKALSDTRSDYERLQEIEAKGIEDGDLETLKEYQDLSNKIAQTAPELVSYYDEQGNAIIDLNANYQDLIENEKEVQRVANQAKLGNRDNFVTQYQQDVEEQQKIIETNKKILAELSKGGTYTSESGQVYNQDDIGALTSEITAAQKKITDTRGLINENIVDPIFSSSKAYAELNSKQQKFVRGLADVETISEKMANGEDIDRYAENIERYMSTYADLNRDVSNHIKVVKEEMQQLSKDGIAENEKQRYEELKTLLGDLEKQVQPVSEGFDKLSKASQQSVLDLMSLVDIEEDKFKQSLDNLSNYYEEKKNLMNGPMDLETFNGMVGRDTFDSEQFQADRRQQYDTQAEDLRQQIDAVEIPSMNSQSPEDMEAYNQALAERNQLMLELSEVESAYDSIKGEAFARSLEEQELQRQLDEEYWNHIEALTETVEGYNQVNEALAANKEEVGDMAGMYDELSQQLLNPTEEGLSGLQKYVDKVPELGEALKLSGAEGEEALKKVADKYKDIAQQQGKMYAKLRGNDTDYYKEFLTKNKNQSKLMYLEYGIRADDYKTYNELEKAIAEATRKKKKNIIDQETRAKILAGDQQIQKAWGVADEEVGASAESGKKQIGNSATTAGSVAKNLSAMGKAGVSVWDRVRYAAAVVKDKIVNLWNGAKNSVINMWNGLLEWLGNGLINIAGKIPAIFKKTKATFENLGNKVLGGQKDLLDTDTTENQDEIIEELEESYGGSEEDLNLNYGSGDLDNKTGGSGNTSTNNTTPQDDINDSDDSGGKKGNKGNKGDKEKEVEDMKHEEDIYHDINVQIERKSKLLDKLQKQQDKLYGKALIDNLQKQKDLMAQQQKLLERKLEMQKQDAKAQADALRAQGVVINSSTGMIENYNEIIAARVAAANALSGEAKEAAIKSAQEFIKSLDDYEDFVNNTLFETEQAIQDSIDKQHELFLEMFDYKITIQIEMSEDLQNALSFQKEINDEFEDTSENIERTSKQMTDMMQKITNLEQQYQEVMSNTELSEEDRLKRMEEISEKLKAAVKDLKKLDEEMTKIFKDGLKQGMDNIKEHIKGYENINKELTHMQQMMKLLGKQEDFGTMQEIYKAQYETITGRIDTLLKTKESLIIQRDALEAAGMKGSDEWKVIDDAIRTTNDDINKLTQDAIKNLQEQFKNAANEILDNLENKMTGGLGLDKIKKDRKEQKDYDKKYLDTQERLLAISKLQSKVQKEIDSTDDPAKKAKLKKFMDEEIKRLKEKERITKYDVDRANKMYEISQKQMALDDLKNAKDTMRLVRDSQGNWVYEFTEDLNAVEKAQSDYSKSMEDLYNMDKNNLEKVQDEMLAAQEAYLKEVQEINKNMLAGKYANQEEYNAALEEATKAFNEKMVILTGEYEGTKENITVSTLGVMLDAYKQNALDAGQLTEEEKEAFNILAQAVGGDFEIMKDLINGYLSGDEDSIKNILSSLEEHTGIKAGEIESALKNSINNAQDTWNTQVGDMVSDMVGEGGLEKETNNAIGSMKTEWGKYQTAVDTVTTETGNDFESIKNKIDDANTATNNLNTSTDNIVTTFGKEMEAVTNATTAFQAHREEIRNNIAAYGDLISQIDAAIQKKKEEMTGITPDSGGGGGDGGGGGGSNDTPSQPESTNPQGNGQIDVGDVVTFTGKYWHDSYGNGPWGNYYAGESGAVVVDDINSNTYGVHIGGAGNRMKDLGWVKPSQISGYDTGGYTGDWGTSDGKMAFLHEKEIVLNKEDTKNILDAVKTIRGKDNGSVLSHIANAVLDTSSKTLNAMSSMISGLMSSNISNINNSNEKMQQTVNIEADFSGVKSAEEIERAFDNMANMASQYIHRR